MGLVAGTAQIQKKNPEEAEAEGSNSPGKHHHHGGNSEEWIDLVSGDCQRRSLILPITNISGKAKSATLELREKIEGNTNVDPNLLISAPELGNIRNVRVLGP